MPIALLRAALALAAIAVLARLAPALAAKPFTGPAGWDQRSSR